MICILHTRYTNHLATDDINSPDKNTNHSALYNINSSHKNTNHLVTNDINSLYKSTNHSATHYPLKNKIVQSIDDISSSHKKYEL